MKKLTRKLFLSVFTALFAVVALGTTTFAWFSMNTSVTATGMEVKANASKNILISKESTSGFGSTVTLTGADTLVPVSTVGTTSATAPAFFKINSVGSNMSAEDSKYGDDTTFTTAQANVDYVKQTVYLQSTGAAAEELKANITYTGGSKALDPALRVMLVVNDVTNSTYSSYVYGPVGQWEAYNGISTIGGDQKVATTTPITQSTSSTQILAAMTADTVYQVDIYIWYEGQDTRCKTVNAVDMASTTFAIQFTVKAGN